MNNKQKMAKVRSHIGKPKAKKKKVKKQVSFKAKGKAVKFNARG